MVLRSKETILTKCLPICKCSNRSASKCGSLLLNDETITTHWKNTYCTFYKHDLATFRLLNLWCQISLLNYWKLLNDKFYKCESKVSWSFLVFTSPKRVYITAESWVFILMLLVFTLSVNTSMILNFPFIPLVFMSASKA